MEQVQENKMGTAPVLRLIIAMSLPAMFSMLIQALYNIVDSYFVAQISESALTAVSLAFPIQTLMIAVGVGTGVGINSLVARRLGEKRQADADCAASHGLLLGVFNWILFALFGIFFTKMFFGAFTDIEEIIKERLNKQASIGFQADLKDKYDNDPHLLQKVTVEDIRSFGMIPEFIGRLPIIFTLDGLNEDMLVKILQEPKNAILKQYQKLLALDEVKLEFEDGALHAIAAKALERDTGARALRAILEEYMLDIMYEIPKDDSIGEVVITREYIEGNGGPRILLRGQEPILLEGSH